MCIECELAGDTPLAAGVWYWEIRVDKNTDEMMIGVAKDTDDLRRVKNTTYVRPVPARREPIVGSQ